MTVGESEVDDMRGLGANERAILERIPWRLARRMAAAGVRAKLRIQFTGWLQYLLPLPIIVLLSLLGCLSWLIGGPAWGAFFLVPAGILLAVVAFDIVTIKWKFRFPERHARTVSDLEVLDLLRARRSCRSFQTRRMSDRDRGSFLAKVDAQLRVPTIGGTAPRLEFIDAALTVWPVVNASEFLVAIVPKEYDRTAIIDVGRTLQRIVMDATRMGLGTCWIGPGADHQSLIRHLRERFDSNAEQIVCICAVGYRSLYVPLFVRLFNHQMSSKRYPLSELFFSDDKLQSPIDTNLPPYNRFGRAYDACRWAPSSYNGQTTRAVVEAGPGGSVSAVHFIASTASRYYAPVALGIWCANWELGCEALREMGAFKKVHSSSDAFPRRDVTWSVTAQARSSGPLSPQSTRTQHSVLPMKRRAMT